MRAHAFSRRCHHFKEVEAGRGIQCPRLGSGTLDVDRVLMSNIVQGALRRRNQRGYTMRFLITWKFKEGFTETEQARILAVFAQWQPPIELSDWSGFVDGDGGFAIVETADAKTISQVTAPWLPWFRFSIRGIQPIQETAEVTQGAVQFRQSVS